MTSSDPRGSISWLPQPEIALLSTQVYLITATKSCISEPLKRNPERFSWLEALGQLMRTPVSVANDIEMSKKMVFFGKGPPSGETISSTSSQRNVDTKQK